MTTVVACQKKGKVLLGHDSQATVRSGQKIRMRDGKLTKNGPYTFAVTGFADFITVLEDAELPLPEGDLRRFVRKTLAPALEALETERYGSCENALLIVVGGEVFTYSDGDIGIANMEGVYALGSGGRFAENYLLSLRRPVLSRDVKRSLEVAASRDAFTSGPFFVKEVR